MPRKFQHSLGWIPDYPDIRDYTPKTSAILPMTSRVKGNAKDIPRSVDLSIWCSPVEDQGTLGSCTAHAVASIVEYSEKKASGKYINASRLFLYKVTRNLLHMTGDTGATLKGSLGALIMFGMPPEEYWPYDIESFDKEPGPFCYAFGQNYRCISYFRHDPAGVTQQKVLDSVKKYLAAGIPSVFGFTVYSGIEQAETTGKVPFPSPNEKLSGGHAIAAFGYDDDMVIENAASGKKTKGALLFQNSWGTGWGIQGYGWLPYEYVLQGLACDFWSVLKQDWADMGLFTSEE